ncbi:tetraacyldisaccharide 4'-kinase [Crateriforma conspicua]|uniref:Tetraacyldisaccharide 4'-kinase n=2 Tax=Crateriforma conspicua TaxID=2527996 RepID=A0A5C5Y7H9_9PLAN|nr:tetraacyldisaccharide 4'-kinase [Crateriforma conspicua]QDV65870.1 Tetraacyldisaccharide 4'-kinase [Crateriforma conspicua]TWT71270.1 Tetraacyldisaccharide 4'-kinase [Crateriforma conspicua]
MDYREIMSGRKRGVPAGLLRAALGAGSLAYGLGVRHRNRRFDRDPQAVIDCGVPVISVGNLTTGGTGKTPIVAALARQIRDAGYRVALVSRGYGRGDADQNDEADELYARLPDVPHLQDPDRVAAAKIAVDELEAEVILMDDGFQHRRLHRDLDIVVIDATCPFGYGHLLPRGLLREPVTGIRRADLVILSRCGQVNADTVDAIQQRLAEVDGRIGDQIPLITSDHQPSRLINDADPNRPIRDLENRRIATLCAIGNPDSFESTVRQCGATMVDSFRLPDHDRYEPDTVQRIRQWIGGLDGRVDEVVCTHKDLVKLKTSRLGGLPLSAVQVDWVVLSGEAALKKAVQSVIERPKDF